MTIRVLCSIGVGIATGVLSMIACICIDGFVRPHPDGGYGMYGFVYGLAIAPLAGIAAATLMYLLMRRRAKRAEAAIAPTLLDQ